MSVITATYLKILKKKIIFGTEKAKLNLDKIIFQAKVKGKGKNMAVVGVSGGVDSSYLLYYLQKRVAIISSTLR